LKTYLRKKTINAREYFYDMTPLLGQREKENQGNGGESKESGNVEVHREQSKNIKGEGHKEDVK
jgi:hypothetical protein